MKKKIARRSDNGRLATMDYARRNPATTQVETVRPRRRDTEVVDLLREISSKLDLLLRQDRFLARRRRN